MFRKKWCFLHTSRGFFALFLAIASVGANPARASSFVERPFPETVHDADQIVRGKVGHRSAREATGSDGRVRIYTYYELQLAEVFKGSLKIEDSPTITFRELGAKKTESGCKSPARPSLIRAKMWC